MTLPRRTEYFALDRALNGVVVTRDGRYADSHDNPYPDDLTEAFDRLLREKLLYLGRPNAGGQRRVSITDVGRTRRTALFSEVRVVANDPGVVMPCRHAALTGADFTDLAALRRLQRAGFAMKVGDQYLADEHRMATFIEDGLTALIEMGHVALSDPDPEFGGAQRVTITDSGTARYEELCVKNGIPPSPERPSR